MKGSIRFAGDRKQKAQPPTAPIEHSDDVFEIELDESNNRWLNEVRKQRSQKVAKLFTTEHAWKVYKERHPKADPRNHELRFNQPAPSGAGAPSSSAESSQAPTEPKRVERPKGSSTSQLEIEVPELAPVDPPTVDPKGDVPAETYWKKLLRANGHNKDYVYNAVLAWTNGWLSNSTAYEARQFLSAFRTKGSWANLKYAATQTLIGQRKADLQRRGVMDEDGYVTLYRGIRGEQAEKIDQSIAVGDSLNLKVYGLSCWTESPAVAASFAKSASGRESGDYRTQNIAKVKVHYSRAANMWAAESANWRNGELEWTLIADDSSSFDSEWVASAAAVAEYQKSSKTAAIVARVVARFQRSAPLEQQTG